MIRSALAIAMLAGAVTISPSVASAQDESCEGYMATVQEQMAQLSNDKLAKAMEHMEAAQAAMAENNEERCLEELHMASDEIEANL